MSASRDSELLQHLIRNACVNDGDSCVEVPNADAVTGVVSGPGVDVEILDAAPGRRSVVARWPGTDPSAPTTMFLTHLDVVPADPAQWRHDPFGGELIDGEVWGRGALDMLNHTVTMAHAFADLTASGRHLRGDLVFAAVADEEALGGMGAGWLVEHHPDLVSADWVLTEGGGTVAEDRQVSVLIADKGAWRVELTVTGDSGHSSMPWGVRNPVATAAQVVHRIATGNLPATLSEPWEIVVRHASGPGNGGTVPTGAEFERMLAGLPAEQARVVHAGTHLTMTPTTLATDASWNSIGAEVRVGVDVRTLPGQDWSDVEEALHASLGDLAEVVTIRRVAGSTGAFTPVGTPLWSLLERATRVSSPGARLTPVMGGMTTDARYFRDRGALAYGVGLLSGHHSPGDLAQMVHGTDERIDLASLDLMSALWRAVIAELA